MNPHLSRRAVATAALAGLVTSATALGAATTATASTGAASSSVMAVDTYGASAADRIGVAGTRVLTHFDLGAGEMPENIVLDRDGSVDVTFAASRQVARIGPDGRTTVLATLPAPVEESAKTPVLGFPLVTGLVRDGRTFYVVYATGSNADTGVWKFREGRTPHRIAALPAAGLPNGMAQDPATGTLYVTDSVKGVIYAVSDRGRVRTFSSDPSLAATGFLGANGIKVRHGAVWVTNLDTGTILRIDRDQRGNARTPRVISEGLAGIDDFAFTGRGTEMLVTLNPQNEVRLVDGSRSRVVLTAADGLSNPTSVAVRGRTVFVPSAAYTTQRDPNLLVTTLTR